MMAFVYLYLYGAFLVVLASMIAFHNLSRPYLVAGLMAALWPLIAVCLMADLAVDLITKRGRT